MPLKSYCLNNLTVKITE